MLSSNNNIGKSINDSEDEEEKAIQPKETERNTLSSCKQCFMLVCTIMMLVIVFYASLLYLIPKYATFTSIIRPLTDQQVYEITSLGNQLLITLISNPVLTHGYGEMLINSGSPQFSFADLPHLAELALHQNSTINSIQSKITDRYTSFTFSSPNSNWKNDIEAFSLLFSKSNFSYFDLNKERLMIEQKFNSSFLNEALKEDLLVDSLIFSLNESNCTQELSYSNDTFLEHIRNETFEYYRKHYYGNNMNLVLISNMSLNEMKDFVIDNFTIIKGKESFDRSKKSNDDGDGLNKLQSFSLKKIVFKYMRIPQEQISFIFLLKEMNDEYMTQSIGFISYLLMKGKMSLFKSMEQIIYFTSLDTEIKTRFINANSNYIKLIINLKLTQDGFNKPDKAIAHIVQYLKHIQSEIKEEYFNEFQLKLNNTFNYNEHANLPAFIHNIAVNVFKLKHNLTNVLYNDCSLLPYNRALIQSTFNQLTPENLIIVMNVPQETQEEETQTSMNQLSKSSFAIGFENKTEKFLKTSYWVSDMNASSFADARSSSIMFHPLNLNKYIKAISNTDMLLEINQSLLHDYNITSLFNNKRIKMWYKFDDTFSSGKSYFYLKIVSPSFACEPNQDEQYYSMLLLYFSFKNKVDLAFNEVREGGNDIEISFEDNGLLISIDAYTEVIQEITEELILLLLKVRITEQDLEHLKLQANAVITSKSDSDLLRNIIKIRDNSRINKLNLNQVDSNKVQQIIQSSLSRGIIVGFAYGRLSTKAVEGIITFLLPQFNKLKNNQKDDMSKVSIHKIFEGSVILRRITLMSYKHSLANLYRIKSFSPTARALSSLTSTLLTSLLFVNKSDCFIDKHNFSVKGEIIDRWIYLVIEAQSIRCNPKELNRYIDEKLNEIYDDIQDMSNYTLTLHQKNTIDAFTIPHTVKEKSIIIWNSINNNDTDASPYLLRDVIQNITQAELKSFYKEVFSSSLSKMSIQTFSSYLGDYEALMNEVNEVYLLNDDITSIITNDSGKLSNYLN